MRVLEGYGEAVVEKLEGKGMVGGDPRTERELAVIVGGVGFVYRRGEEGDWRPERAYTVGRGQPIDGAWLMRAWAEARRALAAELVAADALDVDDGTPGLRCTSCGRILSYHPAPAGMLVRIVECGPAHEISVDDKAHVLGAGETIGDWSTWARTEDPPDTVPAGGS